MIVSGGGGLRNFEGWQWSWLQNLPSPSAACVDFHSSSVLHAFEKWHQQSPDLFLVAAIQKHSFVCSRAIFLTCFFFEKEEQMQCSLAAGNYMTHLVNTEYKEK